MEEAFSDDFNLKIGDLLSHPLYPATRKPCARPLMLMRPIQAQSCMFARAPRQFTPARPLHERTSYCKRSFLTPSLVYFRNQKLSQSINTLNPPTPLKRLTNITRCRCSWPLLLLPVLQGAS